MLEGHYRQGCNLQFGALGGKFSSGPGVFKNNLSSKSAQTRQTPRPKSVGGSELYWAGVLGVLGMESGSGWELLSRKPRNPKTPKQTPNISTKRPKAPKHKSVSGPVQQVAG